MLADLGVLNPLFSRVFQDPKNGLPYDITRAGCLALASLGAISWNAWRMAFPTIGGKSNHGYGVSSEYANFADFRDHIFEEAVNFSNFDFGANAVFENAEFKRGVNFSRSKFGEDASFELVKFFGEARFQNVRFEDGARFTCAKFDHLAFFSHAQFGGCIDFTGAKFSGQTNFDKVLFGKKLIFDQSIFDCGHVDFSGASWEDFFSPYPSEEVEDIKLWAMRRGLHPGKINSASFGGTQFNGTANFSGFEFVGETRFSKSSTVGTLLWTERDVDGHWKLDVDGCIKKTSFELKLGIPLVFGAPPIFHNCKFNQDISFDGAEFPRATGFESSIRAYRTLKLAFAQQQAAREEQLFFRLEMAEEAKHASWRQRYLYKAYYFLSDYGFSLWRPLALLLLVCFISASLYGKFANLTLCLPTQGACSISRAWAEFSLLQALPLPGLDKLSESSRVELFANSDVGLGVTFITLFHKALSLLALFLTGLALRNLFKMK